MAHTGVVYSIQNKLTGKLYIGQTINFRTRIRQHFSGLYNCRAIKRAISKYGKDAFRVEIIHDEVPRELLSELEAHCIWSFRSMAPNGYNLTEGGDGFGPEAAKLRSMNKEWQSVMDQRNKAMAKDPKWLARNRQQASDPEWRENHAKGLLRRSSNSEWRRKNKEKAEERAKDPIWREKNRIANQAKAKDPIWLEKTRRGSESRGIAVLCVETGLVYPSARDAYRKTGISDIQIGQCAKGNPKYKSAGGFHWKRVVDGSLSTGRVALS